MKIKLLVIILFISKVREKEDLPQLYDSLSLGNLLLRFFELSVSLKLSHMLRDKNDNDQE